MLTISYKNLVSEKLNVGKMSDYIVEITGLTKTFGKVNALRGIDLMFPKNCIFALLGPNGAGKTTVIKILLGLLKPASGVARVFGKNCVENSLEIRRHIGYLAQNPKFYPQMSARELLTYSASFFNVKKHIILQKDIDELLEKVGLAQKADRALEGFSEGERQRLGIAQAVLHKPQLVILDEPAASLDPMGRHDVLALLEDLRSECTILYSTHILADVEKVGDYAAIFREGTIAACDTIDSLKASLNKNVYSIRIAGDTTSARAKLEQIKYAHIIEMRNTPEFEEFDIMTDDKVIFEKKFLRDFLNESDAVILQFGKKISNLEDVLLKLFTEDGK